MGCLMPAKPLKTYDANGELLEPTPAKKIRLDSPERVRYELANVYREMRSGQLDTADGSKLAYVLSMMAKMFESEAAAKVEAAAPPTPPSLDVSLLSIETQREIARARRGRSAEPEHVVIRGVLPTRPEQ